SALPGAQRSGSLHSWPVLAVAAAKVGFDHSLIPDDIGWFSLGDHPALIEDQYPLCKCHDHLHDMLDNDEGDAPGVNASQQVDPPAQFRRVEAGKHLIKQHQPWTRGQHACNLEALATRCAERSRALVSLLC